MTARLILEGRHWQQARPLQPAPQVVQVQLVQQDLLVLRNPLAQPEPRVQPEPQGLLVPPAHPANQRLGNGNAHT